MVLKTEKGPPKIVNFMTSGVGVLMPRCGHKSNIVKIHYFFKNLLLYSKAEIRQTEAIVMMSKGGSTKLLNFMTSRVGIYELGRGQISHIVKMFISLRIFSSSLRNIY